MMCAEDGEGPYWKDVYVVAVEWGEDRNSRQPKNETYDHL